MTDKQIKRRINYIIKKLKIDETLSLVRSFKGIASAEGTRVWTQDGLDAFIYIVRNDNDDRFSSMILFKDFIEGKTYKDINSKMRYWEKAAVCDVLKVASYDQKLCEMHEMSEFLKDNFNVDTKANTTKREEGNRKEAN